MRKTLIAIGCAIAMAVALSWGNAPDATAQDTACLMKCATAAAACQEKAGDSTSKLMACATKQAACQEKCM